MKRLCFPIASFLLSLVLLSCAEPPGTLTEEEKPPKAEQEASFDEEDLVTRNVVYTGLLEQGGVTIFQQGTHRLMLSDGRMVLLEPGLEGVVLDLYVGKLVQVKGDVSPTVEAGGTIMKVREVQWIRREVREGKEVEVLRLLCGEGAACPENSVCMLSGDEGVCVEEEAEPSSFDEEEREEEEEGVLEEPEGELRGPIEESEGMEEEEDVEGVDDEDMAQLLEEDYASERWTQEYCSTHVGFCIPAHRNWYWKSFGATASLLWHIEMGPRDIEGFGDGPVVVDLKMGDLRALGVSDGDVKKVGSRVIGYRAWADGRHFEISAPSELQEPVMYVTGELKGTE